MQTKFVNLTVLAILLICQFSVCPAIEIPDPNSSTKYLDTVRTFADNVLKYGRDSYGPKHTPLFVDGLNIHTHEPVKWIAPNGDRWILSNLASQQNLFRTLDGLTRITGDPKYKQAAMEAIKYAFENLRSPNGLLYWGHFVAYDTNRDKICEGGLRSHVLKWHYPYYELMWEADPEATKTFIEAFWSAHILDWSNLDMDRIGHFNEFLEEPWHREYKGDVTFFKGKRGSAQLPTGTSLIYAGTVLYKLSGQRQPFLWSKRLAKRYVDTRHPNTGISKIVYNQDWLQLGDDLKEHFVDPHTTFFPCCPFEYPYLQYPENNIIEAYPWMSMFLVGEICGEDGNEFSRWALEELTAWGRASYRKKDNSFVPILTDGTNLEGYVWKEGPIGLNVTKPCLADASFFWSYSVAYSETGDEFMWQMVRDIALGNNFGDIGQTSKKPPRLQTETTCSSVYGLLGFLELYTKTKKRAYLDMAQRVGDNILSSQFHKGFFAPSKRHIYTRFDCFEPLALLHLDATMRCKTGFVPRVWPNVALFIPPYRYKEMGVDRRIIYDLTESVEPPLSLQEVAAIGDIDSVRALIDNGTDVDSLEDSYFKTALHRATINGHKDVVELLLAKGAEIDAGKFGIGTPLNYAAQNGHNKIADLLIANGADVNAKNDQGQTPLHHAAEKGYAEIAALLIGTGANVNARNNDGQTALDIALKEAHLGIAKILLAKGAEVTEVSIHNAAFMGAVDKVKDFLERGCSVDIADAKGRTALHYAAGAGEMEMVEFLIAKCADINAKDNRSFAPLHEAVRGRYKNVVALLIDSGADVNAKARWDYTPIYYAAWSGSTEVVELLVESGADINVEDEWGWTPLHYMAKDDNVGMTQLLITKGADVNAKDNNGKTVLSVAKEKGHNEIVELLRRHGAKEDGVSKEEKLPVVPPADINKKTYSYQMPLHKAAAEADLERVKCLISGGVDVNAESNEGWTALHRAAVFGHADVVEFLLGHCAEINTVNRWGWMPLHSAALYGHKAVVKLLLANGADISAKTPSGETPMQIAKERDYKEIADLLCKH